MPIKPWLLKSLFEIKLNSFIFETFIFETPSVWEVLSKHVSETLVVILLWFRRML